MPIAQINIGRLRFPKGNPRGAEFFDNLERINSVAEALAEPQAAARDMIETVQHPTIGELKLVGMPYKFSGTPASV